MAKTSAAAKKRMAARQPMDVVTALELLALATGRDTLALLRKQVKAATDQLEGQEQDLITRLEAGAVVTGDMVAVVHSEPGQCRPSWKDEYCAHMAGHGVSAETAEAQVRKNTLIPTRKSLVIERKS